MEAVHQTRGLLPLPTDPRTRVLRPSSQGLNLRLLSSKPKTLIGSSLTTNGFRKFHGFSSNPRTRVLHPSSQGLKSSKPKALTGSSLTTNGFRKFHGFSSKVNYSFGQKYRSLFICKAEAAAAADGHPVFWETESEEPKIFGIEITTLKKFIPLGMAFFCILFNYTILKDTNHVLVVTAIGSSAEIIPFLKTWVNLPMAIGFKLLYTKLANVLSKQALFYAVIFPFIAFFGPFGFVLYPLSNYIHPQAFADKLLNILGPRFLPLALMRIWSFCLFYVKAELWGNVVVSVPFWGFANRITTVGEAKRFYPLFGLGANIALIFSGRTVKNFSNLKKSLGPGVHVWAISLKGMMSIVVLMGGAIYFIYWWVNNYVPLPTRSKKKKFLFLVGHLPNPSCTVRMDELYDGRVYKRVHLELLESLNLLWAAHHLSCRGEFERCNGRFLISDIVKKAMAGVIQPLNSIEIPELKGDNYPIWKEKILLTLGWVYEH